MKLRAVEMQGFKSFPDRTKITFDDGVTVIVGPNGCGKSNISDAVKWVFGEQSVKSMRGTKMEDVIFGGSAKRNPTGFAWVSLFIDNTDRSIGVDADEVILTRRLYRSGESEYRINSSPVRLRDLNEIFMDTGLGRDGYSVIEQGKIAEIVSAKSTQRREIFEEAAGISKFRHRKTEAEKKLSAAEENLIRLRDIMGELEGRYEPLRQQAEKAKQYLTFYEEKKKLEIGLWLETLGKLRRQTEEFQDRLLIASSDRTAAEKRLSRITGELDETRRNLQDAKIFIAGKRARIEDLTSENSKAKTDIAVKRNSIERNDGDLDRLRKDLDDGAVSGEELDREIASLREEHESGTAARDAAGRKIRELEGEEAALEAEADGNQAGRRALLLQKEELQRRIRKAEVSGETAGNLAEETASRSEQLRKTAAGKSEACGRLKLELENHAAFSAELADTLERLRNSRKDRLLERTSRADERDRLEAERASCDRQAGERLQRSQVLGDLEKNHESYANSVRLVLREGEAGRLRGILGPVSSLIRAEERVATAVETALGGAVQHIVTEDEEAAKRAIAFLKERKAGRATFLPLTNLKPNPYRDPSLRRERGFVGTASDLVTCDPKYAPVITYLLGRVLVAEDLDAAAAMARKRGFAVRAVTLDGQVVNTGGSLTGGSVNRKASVLGRRNEIGRLDAEAKEFLARSKNLETEIRSLDREIGELDAALRALEDEERTAREDRLRTDTLIRQLEERIADGERLSGESLRELDDLTERTRKLRTLKLAQEETAASLAAEIDALNREDARLSEEAASVADRLKEKAAELSAGRVGFAGLDRDVENLEDRLSRLLRRKTDADSVRSSVERQMDALSDRNATLREEIRVLLETTRDQDSRLDECQRAILEKQEDVLRWEQSETGLLEEERQAISLREASAAEATRLEEKVEGFRTQENDICVKMWDDYQLTRSDAEKAAVPPGDAPAARRRLTELRSRIRSLGQVNVGAVEEFRQLSERYFFMKDQIGDMETSKTELLEQITDLASDMSKIFMQRFDSINRHFGVIFRELFEGGRAELKLSDPADPLEAGIEISVQPPGKIIRSLASLSGGEQAFVAICIYFAILKVNPAPFVLIDEIEAALDDVNVDKFASYLHTMTDRTQFISITHRRGTMEQANVLYGVTMEEEGVSKLLRLDVDEMEKKFGQQLD